METFDVMYEGVRGVLCVGDVLSVQIRGSDMISVPVSSVLSCTVYGKERLRIIYDDASRQQIVLRVLDDKQARAYDAVLSGLKS